MLKLTRLTCEYMKSPLLVDEAAPRFAWALGGGGPQAAYRITVKGPEGTVWDSGRVACARCVHIEYEGRELSPFTGYAWQVEAWDAEGCRSEETSLFRTGAMGKGKWTSRWIGAAHKGPVYFLKRFNLEKAPREAFLYASALGMYRMEINGHKVGDSYFDPGWTDYRKRIQYQAYDVAAMLKDGENQISGVVADGWYCGNIAIAGREMYGTYPLYLFAELKADGFSLAADNTWLASKGPLLSSDLQSGDIVDFRAPFQWRPVDTVRNDLTERLSAQAGPQIKIFGSLKAKRLPSGGEGLLFDFGQNFAGWAQIRIKGRSGQKITVRHGEMLTEDGGLYTENLRTAGQTDIYYLKGGEEEILEPLFTYHGFRYIEIAGIEKGTGESIREEDILGLPMRADLPETMTFKTSDPLINRLWENVLWSQRSNFFSVPTDCPQRDERMGWTGDITAFCRSACFNMECAAYFEKYLRDMLDAQRPNGAITDVVPDVFLPGGNYLVGAGNAAWGDAVFILPYTLYKMYGDKRAIETYFPMMETYMKYLGEAARDFIGPDQNYGDWLSVGEDTPKALLSTAFYALDAGLMEEMAELIGNTQAAREYGELSAGIRAAFKKRFLTEDGRLEGDTQTGYALALCFGLLDKEEERLAAHYLAENIQAHGNHLTTGFVGVGYLLPALSGAGREELALKLLFQKTYPSWLYSVLNGATTIWERWNSYSCEDGFGDVDMNSFNHYSLGSVAEWLYGYGAGIRIAHDENRLPVITLKPLLESFDELKASYDSIYGVLSVEWDKEGLTVCIPAGQRAALLLPGEKQFSLKHGMHRFILNGRREWEEVLYEL